MRGVDGKCKRRRDDFQGDSHGYATDVGLDVVKGLRIRRMKGTIGGIREIESGLEGGKQYEEVQRPNVIIRYR